MNFTLRAIVDLEGKGFNNSKAPEVCIRDNLTLRKVNLHTKPRITVLTLGVDELERSLHFYRDGFLKSMEKKWSNEPDWLILLQLN